MHLLRFREPQSDDEDREEPLGPERYQPEQPWPLRVRCYACAGCGELWVRDARWPRGRQVRCTACRGTGRVTVL